MLTACRVPTPEPYVRGAGRLGASRRQTSAAMCLSVIVSASARGRHHSDSGHHMAEEAPDGLTTALAGFLTPTAQ